MNRSLTFPDGGRWLVILRIGVSLALIAKVFAEFRFIDDLYASDGFIPIDISHFSQNGFIPTLYGLYHMLADLFTEAHFLMAFFLCQSLFATFLLVGFVTRFSAFVCWAMQVVVFNSTHLTSYGFDAILLSLLFYSLIFPVGKYLSLDNIRRNLYPISSPMLPAYRLVMRLHICIIYFANGISKIGGHTWHDGSGIWDAINQPQFHSWLTPLVQKFLMINYVPALVALSIIIIEIAYPFLVWVHGVGRISLALIILLHVFIALVFGLWLFAFTMIVFNLAAFGDILFSNPEKV